MSFKLDKSWQKVIIPLGIVGVFFLLLLILLPESGIMRDFFLGAWYIQAINTWLFLVGLLYWWQRQVLLKGENALLVQVHLPDKPIFRDKAIELVESAPEEYREALTVRRFREILQGALYGEDIIRLNSELSRRDTTEIERGHLILTSLKNIIPVVGFLGTVLGLSMGMIHFPEVTDIDALRNALKGFAASLSVSFNTTLLALAYTIVLILLTSFLKEKEEGLVTNLDQHTRMLINGIKLDRPSGDSYNELGNKDQEGTLSVMGKFGSDFLAAFEHFKLQNEGEREQLIHTLKTHTETVSNLLKDINEGVRAQAK